MKTWIPRILNFLLWQVFCFMAGTGLLLVFRLPPGSRGGRGLQAMGLGRHEWGDLHTWAGHVFIALILMHLAMHGRWLWQVAGKRRSWPVWAGLSAGLLLLLWLVFQPVHRHEERVKAVQDPGRTG